MSRYDAVLLGAGPAGSSAAFFLAQAGWRVAIVEKAAFPRRKVCGEFVSATTFPILDAIGIGDAMRAAGGPPTRRVGLYVGSRTVTAPMPAVDGHRGWGRTLARAVLDPALLDAAQGRGVDVYQPWKAVALEHGAVTIASEGRHQRLEAPVVVAAHGSWEIGTLSTQSERDHRDDDVLAFKAFFHDATFDDDLMILAGFPGGYGGMVHRDRDTVGLSFCVRRDVLRTARARFAGSAWEALLRHVAGESRGIDEAVAGARLESAPRAAGPLNPGIRPRYAAGLFRVGNAAGEAHPTIAEGISMAIQSGFILGTALEGVDPHDRQALDSAGRRYSQAWSAQFAARIRTADAYARLCMGPFLGRAMIAATAALPTLLTAGAVWSGKTKLVAPSRLLRLGERTD